MLLQEKTVEHRSNIGNFEGKTNGSYHENLPILPDG